MIFSKEIKEFQRFQINQTNSNLSPCHTIPTSLSPHSIMQCSMMGYTQATKVLQHIRSALCQRYPVVYQCCLDIPAFRHAHFAKRMLCQLRRTDCMPCSGMVSFLVRWITVEAIIIPVSFLPVLRTELSIRQVRAAGILAGL